MQQSELHYRTLIETMPNGVITMTLGWDSSRPPIFMPQRCWDISNIQDAIGKNLFDYIAPTDLEKCTGALKHATEKGFYQKYGMYPDIAGQYRFLRGTQHIHHAG